MADIIAIAFFVLVFSLAAVGLAWALGRVKGGGRVMCVAVQYQNEVANNVGELRRLLNSDDYVMDKRYEHEFYAEDSWCLCCLDIAATVRKCGFKVVNADDPASKFICVKVERKAKGGSE